jgi:hypothetical protein
VNGGRGGPALHCGLEEPANRGAVERARIELHLDACMWPANQNKIPPCGWHSGTACFEGCG